MRRSVKLIMGFVWICLLMGCSQPKEINVRGLAEYTKLPSHHLIQTIDFTEAKEIIADGSGIIFMSYPGCPWCQEAIAVVNEVAKELKINEVYYLNVKELKREETGINEYDELTSLLRDHLTIENGEPVMYVPDTYVIKNGEILGHHLGTTDSHDAFEREMNEDELNELKTTFRELFQTLK
ncbi:MAG: TlpA family protein disulfide reductase [Turicibacter sp.]